ncbi:prepilin-type cleavage/methylation domain-containing protein [Litorilituus sediminis]|uniref:Prepilin-type cleavage/methylation domain-containing protein n=1 Tax=Litorilituus sediminis TaxID=718192 RepID=A0A4P6P2I9_9GAMM|nr:prepilin-type cleavage/methylation domain-containing protein [Litorilituus sediminis]
MHRVTLKQLSRKQQGFTIVEIFIALSIGLVLLAGVVSIFAGIRSTSSKTSNYGEMQENGRFAISVLTEDLQRASYWGDDFKSVFDQSTINPVPAAPGNECNGGGINNGTFPGGVGPFRALWGETVDVANPMGCFNDAKLGSDLIQIKRVVANELVDNLGNPIVNAPAGNFYLVANEGQGVIFPPGAVPVINNARVWQYQHHVYYVREEDQGGNPVPVLMQGQLTNQMSFAPIIDGIEMIRFMYGIDTTIDPNLPGYGDIDMYVSADGVNGGNGMTEAIWNGAGGRRILAVKIFVLARSTRPDITYRNTNTYQLGDLPITFNDNFRRLLFTSTVILTNTGTDVWP